MNVRIIVGASAAYASISDAGFSADVRLSPGRSAAASLRQSAAEMHQRAADLTRRAARIERAASILEDSRNGKA